jgi:hypothetical protein
MIKEGWKEGFSPFGTVMKNYITGEVMETKKFDKIHVIK